MNTTFIQKMPASTADYALSGGGAGGIEGVEFGATSARAEDGLSRERWRHALHRIASIERGSPWWIGDLLAFGDTTFGNGSYADAAEVVGRTPDSLKQSAYISRSILPEVRVKDVSYRAHRLVAAMAPEEQRSWLRRAADARWTSDELHEQIQAEKEARLPTGQNRDLDHDAHWNASGSPRYDPPPEPLKLVVNCETQGDLDDVLARLGSPTIHKITGRTSSIWWPDRPKDDVKSLEFS